jgi:hypothetical protein
MSPQSAASQLFTLRLWREDIGEGRTELRGRLQHVLSGEVRYFRDWSTLAILVTELLAPYWEGFGQIDPCTLDECSGED